MPLPTQHCCPLRLQEALLSFPPLLCSVPHKFLHPCLLSIPGCLSFLLPCAWSLPCWGDTAALCVYDSQAGDSREGTAGRTMRPGATRARWPRSVPRPAEGGPAALGTVGLGAARPALLCAALFCLILDLFCFKRQLLGGGQSQKPFGPRVPSKQEGPGHPWGHGPENFQGQQRPD